MMGKKREKDGVPMQFVAIILPPRAALTPAASALLAGYVRRRSGRPPWPRLAAEEHSGPAGTLLLLHPAPAVTVRVADWAKPFLRKYL